MERRYINPKRLVVDPERVEKELALLERQEISYEDLMNSYNKGLMMWAKRYLKDFNSQERVKRIKREALKISIRRVAVDGAIYNRQISEHFPHLYGAAMEIYEKKDGKSGLQRLAEDAGIVYFQKNKHRNLRQLLEDTAAFERGDYDKSHGGRESIKRILNERFGLFGKGVIFAGFDFLSIRQSGGFKKSDYVFSSKELASIVKDSSLTEEEKARCIFNALSFQYYEFLDGCKVAKELNGIYYLDADEKQDYLNGKLEIAIANRVFDDVDCAVGIYFSGDSRFRATNFEFSGENSKRAENAGRDFYNELEEKLRFLRGSS